MFQNPCFSENLVVPGIEPGTSGSVARNSDHRGGHEPSIWKENKSSEIHFSYKVI
jgi:hypothetical protein